MDAPKITEKERSVLSVLAAEWNDDYPCFYFRGIVSMLKGLPNELDERQVRLACRSLARKGLAKFERGLFNDDGEVAGSGYCATRAGAALMSPCDVCGDLATFEYNVDEKGEHSYEPDDPLVRECETHYKKSPKLNPSLCLK